MNENQGQQETQLKMELVLEEYKVRVEALTHEDIFKNAYIKQLEAMVKELQEKLQEATTIVEVTDNN